MQTRNTETSGYILLNKKAGITSFEALDAVKKAFSTSKVGHTGTLDKFAEGLLLVLVGRAVKLSPWVSGSDKQYQGIIRFGVETDTLDPEGEPVAQASVPTREQLEAAIPGFRGDLLQAPPAYSAVHVNGERASRLARSGKSVEMEKRPVSVYALDLLSYEPPLARIRVHCSKGTYIRSLARDLALAAGSRGHLVSLTRTHIAGFQVTEAAERIEASGAFRPIDAGFLAALGLPALEVDDAAALGMIHGKPLDRIIGEVAQLFAERRSDKNAAGVFRKDGSFVGIIEESAGEKARWRYGYVYAHA
jgi:tRNA pseudouridine55 synthase